METIVPALFHSALCLGPGTPTQTVLARPGDRVLRPFPFSQTYPQKHAHTHCLAHQQPYTRGRGGPHKRLFLYLAGGLIPEEGRGLDMACCCREFSLLFSGDTGDLGGWVGRQGCIVSSAEATGKY